MWRRSSRRRAALVHGVLAVLRGWRAALSAGELRALSREITAQQGTLASAGCRAWPRWTPGMTWCRRRGRGRRRSRSSSTRSGVDPHTARRDSATAQLLDPDTGDLKVIGAAYAAGEVLRGHVDVAVRTHRDLGEKIREELIPLESAGPGERGVVRRVEAVDALLAAKAREWVCASWTGSPAPWSRS